MARLVGYGGEVTVATVPVTGIKSWKLDYTFDTLEGTGFDSGGAKVYTPGLKGWNGSFEGYKDGAPLTIGTEIALVLKESATGTQKYNGQAIVTGLHPSVGVDGLAVMSYDFQGTAGLTVPTT